MERVGLGRPFDEPNLNFFNFFNSNYPIVKEAKIPLNFSQVLAFIALQLNKVFHSNTSFSIYFLSGIYYVLYVAGFYLFINNSSRFFRSRLWQFILIILAVLIFSDIMFVSYFNSFYQEAVFLISGVFVIAFSVERRINYNYLIIALFILSLSKAQNLIFIFLPIFLILLKWKKTHKILIICTILITSSVLFIQLKVQQQTNEANLYEAVFLGVLLEAEKDEQIEVLKEQGLYDQNYLRNVGRGYWRPENDIYKYNLNEDFYSKINNLSILKMYLSHPALFIKTGLYGLKLLISSSAQPEHLGNLSIENSTESRKTLVKSLLGQYLNYIFLPFYIFSFLYYLGLKRPIKNLRENRIILVLLLLIPVVYLANYAAGGINDFIKHNLSVYFMICILILILFISISRSFLAGKKYPFIK